ncbi:MAG: O-antigen ligase family protein [Acidobacteriota bacterium]
MKTQPQSYSKPWEDHRSPKPDRQSGEWLRRVLPVVAFLVPLASVPGLKHPFSTPKFALVGATILVGLSLSWFFRPRLPRLPAVIQVPLFAWLVVLSISAITGETASLEGLLIQVFGIGWFVLLIQVRPSLRHLSWALVLSGVAVAGMVLFQYLGTDPFVLVGWVPLVSSHSRMRTYATLGNPNFVGAFLVPLVPVTMALYLSSTPMKDRWTRWLVPIFLLELLAIFATGSRGAGLGLLGAVLGWSLLDRARLPWRQVAVIVAVAAALVTFSPARGLKTTIEGRMYLWRITAQHVWEAGLFGLGPGSFLAFFPQWETDWWRQGDSPESHRTFAGAEDHAHNDFLEFWVEQGTLGLVSFLALIIACFGTAKRWTIASSKLEMGSAAGVISLLAVALVDFPLHRVTECFLFWTLLGCLFLSSGAHRKMADPFFQIFAPVPNESRGVTGKRRTS